MGGATLGTGHFHAKPGGLEGATGEAQRPAEATSWGPFIVDRRTWGMLGLNGGEHRRFSRSVTPSVKSARSTHSALPLGADHLYVYFITIILREDGTPAFCREEKK